MVLPGVAEFNRVCAYDRLAHTYIPTSRTIAGNASNSRQMVAIVDRGRGEPVAIQFEAACPCEAMPNRFGLLRISSGGQRDEAATLVCLRRRRMRRIRCLVR